MKSLILAAAVALALPALAIEADKPAPQPQAPVEQATAPAAPASDQAKEELARDDIPLPVGGDNGAVERGKPGSEVEPPEPYTLRFERWVQDADNNE